jgi:hypothetical protein
LLRQKRLLVIVDRFSEMPTLTPDLSTLPEDIPSLMLGYLNELNRDVTVDALADRIVHQDAKALAWACVKPQFYPNAIERGVAISTLASLDRPDPELHLHYLEHKLRLIETVGTAQDKIRFCLDPLAEYLAALAAIDLLKDNADEWQTAIVKPVRQITQIIPIETMRGFLLAVQDVCRSRSSEVHVYADVAQILAQLVGM